MAKWLVFIGRTKAWHHVNKFHCEKVGLSIGHDFLSLILILAPLRTIDAAQP